MTIYDMNNALQRVLIALEKSLPSSGGLPPSLTVDLGSREERLAARLVQRLGLEPPIDVEKIASAFAGVVSKRFPTPIDGLCLDLKVYGKKPKIWISATISRVRRRFTLAHEIGHIIIPWHVGTIIDEIDAPDGNEATKYREMEAEANRFAAELLMPTAWVQRTIVRYSHPGPLMEAIRRTADVSYFAAMLKVIQHSPAGYVCAQVFEDKVAWSGRTTGTFARQPKVGAWLGDIETLVLEKPHIVRGGDATYFWWKVREDVAAPVEPERSWRAILEELLLSLPPDKRVATQRSVNAVIGNAFGRLPKGTAVDRLYAAALARTQNRHDRDEDLRTIFQHPSFGAYLIARCYEHSIS